MKKKRLLLISDSTLTQKCSIASESCTFGPAMDVERSKPCLVSLDGYRVFIIGGAYQRSTQILNMRTGTVEMNADMSYIQ